MKGKELHALVLKDIERYLKFILSNGKVNGKFYEVGDIDNNRGKSLKVNLYGEHAGFYCDFAGNEKGDLINLTQEVKNCGFVEACNFIKDFLRVKDDNNFYIQKKRTYKRYTQQVEKTKKEAMAIDYLIDLRKIPQDIVNKFKCFYTVSPKTGAEYVNFPYYVCDEVFLVKTLALERDEKGKKIIHCTKDAEPCLFGWQACDVDSRDVIICEGEIDAMTYRSLGFNALSVPFGCGNFDWLDFEYDRIMYYDNILISFDNDNAGKKATNEILTRIGIDKIKVINLELKDANEYLTQGKEKELLSCVEKADFVSPEEFKNSMDFADGVADFVFDTQINDGVKMKLSSNKLNFVEGQVSLWTGINGHGKSLIIGQTFLDIILQNKKVCIASLEMLPATTLGRMVRQACGARYPTSDELISCVKWFSDYVFIFDFVGVASYKRLLKTFAYAYKRHGVTQFLIDSMMLLDVHEDDREGQKNFMLEVCNFAKTYNSHVHIVAHPRKIKSEYEMPNKMDINGSGMLSNSVDNVFIVWRNKEKEMTIDKANFSSASVADIDKARSVRSHPDAIINICKNRLGQFDGAIPLWFAKPSGQFLTSPSEKPCCLIPEVYK